MDSPITDLLLYIGLVLVMVAYWTFYIRYVRRIPGSEEWYDSAEPEGAESDGLLFIYPFGTLLMGAGGALGLVVSMGLPEPVEKVLGAPFMVAMLIALIGLTGAFGIPLPWPFVPRWVVDIRKAKRARRRERRQARKMTKKE
ncbi:TPA: hypothetical protein JAJ60_002566 [Corynebacterium striatum]|uniref:hypothetical protein n=1 Tax=Corynebacterium TaxID=1716 RepID=UPI0006672AA1|nr:MULTISPECIES: hypothetical protein [Corynebacterium]ATZ04897.1 hypothetical protein BBR43_00630 [Corynebacterium striatum]EGT5575765.1 hypothetical protein [Corynebacterium striatum]EGT5788438.1 hypothetical protein [Corynebacterium striatum]KAA1263866.1 hypothetical protein D7S42_09310 [Corynebacterium striatum]MBD0856468.1 hypothetical protein [Corynebacterium striatum]